MSSVVEEGGWGGLMWGVGGGRAVGALGVGSLPSKWVCNGFCWLMEKEDYEFVILWRMYAGVEAERSLLAFVIAVC